MTAAGSGTAANEILDYFGLEGSEKSGDAPTVENTVNGITKIVLDTKSLQYQEAANWVGVLFAVQVVGWAMFVGNDTGVSFGLLFQKLFVPSGGVSPLYFLRNYGVLLAVSVVCCTPLIEKLWNLLRRRTLTRVAAILVLLVVSTAYVVGSTNSPFLYFNF